MDTILEFYKSISDNVCEITDTDDKFFKIINGEHLLFIQININNIITNDISNKLKKCGLRKCDILNITLKNKKITKYNIIKYEEPVNISRKRKQRDSSENNSKRQKIEVERDWSQWVSASKVRNYLMRDPLLDWLNFKKETKVSTISYNKNLSYDKDIGTLSYDKDIGTLSYDKDIGNNQIDNFSTYILKKGIDYENVVIKTLRKKFANDIIQIGDAYDARKISKYEDTINAMKKGIPLIYQGILHNEDNQTYGAPDLIVRSDYINKLVKTACLTPDEEKIPAPKLGLKKYHYRIIDVKCCILNLTSNGTNILNSGSVYAYKGQLYIYTLALGRIMGYTPENAYILGRGWHYVSCKTKYANNDCFDKLGIINYADFDEPYKKTTIEAIEWIRRVRNDGLSWSITDKNNNNRPTVSELYPNMSNHYDSEWRSVKEDIAEQLKEITAVWQCGVHNREMAHSKNIYEWTDKKCTAKTLGISSKIYVPIIDTMLKINKSKNKNININKKIKNNYSDWQKTPKLEFFVDFETINETCSEFRINNNNDIVETGNNIIFMIGVGYELDSKWNFITFLAKDNTFEEEGIMLSRFCKYIIELKNRVLGPSAGYPNMFHWGHIERTLFNSAINKHSNLYIYNNFVWVDILKIFKTEPIVINGCLNFGLKSVAKAMCKWGMIKTTWEENKCSSGTNAMLMAYNEYNNYKQKQPIKFSKKINEIAEYNEIDCKVLWEIINYLRTYK